jgi:metallopeptidase MepB
MNHSLHTKMPTHSNALPRPPLPPPVVATTASSILSSAQQSISHTRSLHTALTNTVSPSTATATNVLLPLTQAENGLITASRLVESYEAVSPSTAVRDASAQAKELFAAFKIETAMNEALFALIDAVLRHDEWELDHEARRWLEKMRREHVANGLSLPPGPERERFKEIKRKIGELESGFQGSLKEARSPSGGIWFSRDELDGVDESVLGRFMAGVGENKGLLKADFGNSNYLAVLRSAKSAESRKRMFVAADNVMAARVPLFKEAIILRDEAARLLGYPSHAAFSTSDKMAQNPQNVDRFLAQLQNGLLGAVQNEIRRLKDLKQKDVEARGEEFDGRYFIWDHLFYHTISLKRDFNIDQQNVSEYFSYSSVVSGMLNIFEKIIGLRFSELDRSGSVWHEDVELYGVWNAEDLGGEFLGYLYLDLYPREGKSNNPWSLNLVPVSSLISKRTTAPI